MDALVYTVVKGTLSSMSERNIKRIVKKYGDFVRKDHPDMPQRIYPHIHSSNVKVLVMVPSLGVMVSSYLLQYLLCRVHVMQYSEDAMTFLIVTILVSSVTHLASRCTIYIRFSAAFADDSPCSEAFLYNSIAFCIFFSTPIPFS